MTVVAIDEQAAAGGAQRKGDQNTDQDSHDYTHQDLHKGDAAIISGHAYLVQPSALIMREIPIKEKGRNVPFSDNAGQPKLPS